MAGLLKFAVLVFFLTQAIVARQHDQSSTISPSQGDFQGTERSQPSKEQKLAAFSGEEEPILANDDQNNHEIPVLTFAKSAKQQAVPNLADVERTVRNTFSGPQPYFAYLAQNSIATVSQTPSIAFVCRIMRRIRAIFRQRVPPGTGAQFAVLAIIPMRVQDPNNIDHWLDHQFEGINYRFTRPTFFPNQGCRTHAEVVAISGRPNEPNFNPQQLYVAFNQAHPDPADCPRFAVLYTWIHPCRDCTRQIIDMFGTGGGNRPVWNIPTYIGRTTAGEYLHPPLTDNDRDDILDTFKTAQLYLLNINHRLDEIYYAKESMQDSNELCDTCTISGATINDIFNCNEEQNAVLQKDSLSTIQQGGTCTRPTPVVETATNKTCVPMTECGYHGYNYSWCNTTDGSWDYCCTGQCGNHRDTSYDWCVTGNTWTYCHRQSLPYPTVTAKGESCSSQCAYGSNTSYAWCYKENGSWDYCCTSECEQYESAYDWCTTGTDSKWQYCKRDISETTYFSATGKSCKPDSPCGYHGQDYSWCYTTDGSWDYCCTGSCGIHSPSDTYDWCTSGNTWSRCKVEHLPYPQHTHNLTQCMSDHPCGYYGQNYAWCYTTDGSWDYCCTQECDLHGKKYDWCTVGNSWKYCQREKLPETSITASGEQCQTNNCGYHGYDYAWCYTESSWDYCCSSTCGKYGTESDFCASGSEEVSCCCSQYD